jgi:excinuclease ABC subunit C
VAPPALIARKLEALPDVPGVYLWKDARGEILYVGKAKSLRDRVRNYFGSDEPRSAEQSALIEQLADLETILVQNEAQALLFENNLIKEHQPRFNIRLRDDKSYPRIAVTLGEPFPRVLVVRRVNIPGARYFGPYTDVATLRRTLRLVRRLFTVRSCHYDLPDDHPDRPCLDYHIERCRAPCVAYQGVAEYRRMIDDVVLFLEGKTADVRARLRERMLAASGALDFERAAQLRDALRWLDQVERPQAVEVVGSGDADAIGLARDGDDACGVILRVRDGRLIAREHRFLENVEHAPDAQVLSAFLVRYYLPLEARAARVLLPLGPADFDALRQLAPEVDWQVPQRGSRAKLAELADQNARHLLESLLIESFDIEERAADPVYALGRDLNLSVVPRAFVCIDISTNQGRDTVGALVWFEGGRPKKSEYRRYRIKGVPQPDDYAAIREVVTRFLTRRRNEGKAMPQLIVIDGGKGQLAAALEATRAPELQGIDDIPIASLAKREEEVFLPGQVSPLRLSRRSPSLRLLQRARDEAHRFAISYSRKRRARRTITSELLTIRGIGPARRRALLERFGSLAGVKTATPSEIAALPGFSTRLAERILEQLKVRA